MSIYTKEFLEKEAIKNMEKSGVSKEVQNLFKEKMWDPTYSNMLSKKGLFFVLTFLSEKQDNEYTSFYSTHINVLKFQVSNLIEKLNNQDFIFYFGDTTGYNSDDNLFILEPKKEFTEKIALFGGIDNFLEGL